VIDPEGVTAAVPVPVPDTDPVTDPVIDLEAVAVFVFVRVPVGEMTVGAEDTDAVAETEGVREDVPVLEGVTPDVGDTVAVPERVPVRVPEADPEGVPVTSAVAEPVFDGVPVTV
jgi:hypothetical protein